MNNIKFFVHNLIRIGGAYICQKIQIKITRITKIITEEITIKTMKKTTTITSKKGQKNRDRTKGVRPQLSYYLHNIFF